MDINYGWVIPVVILALILVLFLIVRNRKDRKNFEEGVNESEVPPERHEDEGERL